MLVGQRPGDVGQQPVPVQRLDLDRDQERARRRSGAQHTSTSRSGARSQVVGVDAVGPVHRDPVVAGDEADDLVAGHRRAALGQLDPAGRWPRRTSMSGCCRGSRRDVRPVTTRSSLVSRRPRPRRPRRDQPVDTAWALTVPSPIAGVERGHVRTRKCRPPRSGARPSAAGAPAGRPCAAAWRATPCPARSTPRAARAEVLADLGPGAGTRHEVEPVPARSGVVALEVSTSTWSPLFSSYSSGTSRSFTRAPTVRWPTSVCTA